MSKILINLLLLATATVIAVLLGLYAYSVYILINQATPQVTVGGDKLIQYDPHIGFRPAPNSRTIITRTLDSSNLTYELITDSRGARISSEDERGQTNSSIAFIGCSFTWGHGISNEETYARKISHKLGTSVQNLAMGSYGGVQSLKMLQKFVDNNELVVYGFIDDHVRRNVRPCAPSYSPFCLYVPTVSKNDKEVLYIKDEIPADNVSASLDYFEWARQKRILDADNIRFGYRFINDRINRLRGLQNVTLQKEDGLLATEFVINEMRKSAKEKGSKLLVVNVGIGQPTDNFDRLSKKQWDENVMFLDASKFDGVKDEALLIKEDGHPNGYGNSLIADKIFVFIKKNNLVGDKFL
jgi:hypothetical protein